MDNRITKGDFLRWKESPVTQALFKYLEDTREDVVRNLLETTTSELRWFGHLQGQAHILDEVVDISYDVLTGEPIEE